MVNVRVPVPEYALRFDQAGVMDKLLISRLERGPADAAAVSLLQIQALRVVMIESGLEKSEQARAEILVPLSLRVKDGSFHGRRVGLV